VLSIKGKEIDSGVCASVRPFVVVAPAVIYVQARSPISQYHRFDKYTPRAICMYSILREFRAAAVGACCG
jgi:hypothetical protein